MAIAMVRADARTIAFWIAAYHYDCATSDARIIAIVPNRWDCAKLGAALARRPHTGASVRSCASVD